MTKNKFAQEIFAFFLSFFLANKTAPSKAKQIAHFAKEVSTMFYTDVIVRYDLLYCRYLCPSFIKMSVFATMYCRMGYNVRIRYTVSVRVRTKCMLFANFPTLVCTESKCIFASEN